MNLYLISLDAERGYDIFSSAVVVAESADKARVTHPSKQVTHITNGRWMGTYSSNAGRLAGKEYEATGGGWVTVGDVSKINVELIGTSDREAGVICASFNAG